MSREVIGGAIVSVVIGAGIFVWMGGAEPLEPTPAPDPTPTMVPVKIGEPVAAPPTRAQLRDAVLANNPDADATPQLPDEDDEDRADAAERPDPSKPPLTERAMEEQDMVSVPPDSSEYDAPTEARQRFHAFEMAAISDRPLDPAKWRVIQGDHGEETLKVLKRAKELTDADQPEAARELMDEWNRLTSLYRNEAYGRGTVITE